MVTLLPVATLGSSPHAGNGRLTHAVSLSVRGLLPARGERTMTGTPWVSSHRAHPRTRGTDLLAPHLRYLHPGSSPHAGNGPSFVVSTRSLIGLIPARGERTPDHPSAVRASRAHP